MDTKIAHPPFNIPIVWIVVKSFCKRAKETRTSVFNCIATGDETRVYYYGRFSQQGAKIWKKPNEETPTRLRRTSPTEKDHDGNFLEQIWYSADRTSATWNYNQRFLLCINHQAVALRHSEETSW